MNSMRLVLSLALAGLLAASSADAGGDGLPPLLAHLDKLVHQNPGEVQRATTPEGVATVPAAVPPARSCKTVAELASATPNLSILLSAVVAANLSAPLSDANGDLTVFAPTNAAFASLIAKLNTTAPALLANKPLLRRVLLYHVVSGARKLPTTGSATLKTLESESLVVRPSSGSVVVVAARSTAKVLTPNVAACKVRLPPRRRKGAVSDAAGAQNSYVNIIDTVLVPSPQ